MAQQRVWDVLVSGQCWWRSWWLWGNLWKVVRVWVLRGGGDLLGIITGRGQSRGRQDTISYQRRTATRPDPRILQQGGGHGRNGRFGGFSGFGGRLWWLWYQLLLARYQEWKSKENWESQDMLTLYSSHHKGLSWSDRIFRFLLLAFCGTLDIMAPRGRTSWICWTPHCRDGAIASLGTTSHSLPALLPECCGGFSPPLLPYSAFHYLNWGGGRSLGSTKRIGGLENTILENKKEK